MRALAGVLVALIAAIQYPLWIGKGGWLRVWEADKLVTQQRDRNTQLGVRNDALEADVRDLKQGTEAIEERARYELGMVKPDEVFFQFVEVRNEGAPPPHAPPK